MIRYNHLETVTITKPPISMSTNSWCYKKTVNLFFYQTEDTKGVLMANGQMIITEVNEDNEPKSLPIIVSIN